MIKRQINKKYKNTKCVYTNRVIRCMKKKLREIKGEINKSTIIFGHSKPPHQKKKLTNNEYPYRRPCLHYQQLDLPYI